MPDIWLFVGYSLISVLSGVITCGLIFALGGLGVVNRRLNGLETSMLEQEAKTLRLQKQKASAAAQEVRRDKMDNNQLLFELEKMKATENVQSNERPSVLGLR